MPASISVRAGGSVPITVHAVRRDSFAGEIAVRLKSAPKGFALGGARVPARMPSDEPIALHVEGRATIQGRAIVRQATAAEDMMQAFIYHHLVPMQNLTVAVIGPQRFRAPWKLLDKAPVKLPAGGTASVRFSMPRGPQLEKVQLTLHDAPAGVTIQDILLTEDGATIVFQTDEKKLKPGLKGNLIVEASVERTVNSKKGKAKAQKRTMSLGSLPAIPFEIVARHPKKIESATTPLLP